MKAAVHLHQFSEMFFALSPSPVLPPFPLPTPKSCFQHPEPQCLGIHYKPIFCVQVLGRQRRPETLAHRPAVLLPYQIQHLLPKLRRIGMIRAAPGTAVFQTRSSLFAIVLPQPLGLPVTHTQQPARVHHPQLLAAHSRQHFRPSQFLLTHLCPPQSDLLSEV
jgi:hypothetical protein